MCGLLYPATRVATSTTVASDTRGITNYFRSKILPDGCKRLKIEQDHVLEEAIYFYKHSDFEPNLTILVTYDGQAGIDAGGLSSQFFTDLLLGTSTDSNRIPVLLEGWNGQKLIAYNPTVCRFDLIETFGKIVAYSIVQTGLGFSCLEYAIPTKHRT